MPANTLDHTPISAVLIAKLILPETDFLRLDGIVMGVSKMSWRHGVSRVN
jgi:hypothetical protein